MPATRSSSPPGRSTIRTCRRCRGGFSGLLQTGWIGDPRETWLLADDDGIAGWYLLELPARDNGHLGFLDITVRPDGNGTGLAPPCCGTPPAGRSRTGAGC